MAASSAAANTAWLQKLQDNPRSLELATPTIALTLVALILVPVVASLLFGGKRSSLPVANPPKLLQSMRQKQFEFAKNGMKILSEARARFRGKPFILITNTGPFTILPPEKAHEIRNMQQLNHRKVFSDVC